MAIINPTEDQLAEWLYQQQPTPARSMNSGMRTNIVRPDGMSDEEFNRWLSSQTMRGIVGNNQLSDLAQPMNTIRSSSGRNIDLNYAAPGGSGVSPEGFRAAYDPHVDGPRVLSRKQLPDGTFEVIKEVPARDGFGRQSSTMVREIETPSYLNPAELKRVDYLTKMAELQKKQAEAEVIRNPALMQIPKMKPGERWNPQEQRVEAVPGSSEYITQSGKHSKDYDAQQTVVMKMSDAINRVNDILAPENKAAFERNFGGWNAMISQYFPGEGLKGKNKIDQLKSILKGAGLEMIRSGGSIGQMTEREWPIVERMIANVNPTVGEEEAKIELEKVAQYMKNIKDKAIDIYQTEWGKTQFYKPQQGGGGGTPQSTSGGMTIPVASEADAMRLPPGTRFKLPDGRTGTAR